MVTVTVTARDPYLGAEIVNHFVGAVNDFNTRIRQSQAARRRVFIDGQTDSVAKELQTAEDKLKRFYEENRSWAQSPQLQFKLGQLQRQVDIVKDLYLNLRRDLETARIAELDDVPLISVVDVGAPSHQRATPNRGAIVLVGLVIGVGVAVLYAYLKWYLEGLPGHIRLVTRR
jgi:uncharacterized protein involved in exopolysaccharide biosynthesis